MALITKMMMRWGLMVKSKEPKTKTKSNRKRVESKASRVISFKDLKRKHSDIAHPEKILQRIEQSDLNFNPRMNDIYEKALLREPDHGWGIERVMRLLQSKPWKRKSKSEIRTDLQAKLLPDNSSIHEIALDALRRDQALDAFEEHCKSYLEQQQKSLVKREEGIKKKLALWIKELETEKKDLKKNTNAFSQWLDKKCSKEQAMSETLEALTDKVRITKRS